jgi:hypothetical protein
VKVKEAQRQRSLVLRPPEAAGYQPGKVLDGLLAENFSGLQIRQVDQDNLPLLILLLPLRATTSLTPKVVTSSND